MQKHHSMIKIDTSVIKHFFRASPSDIRPQSGLFLFPDQILRFLTTLHYTFYVTKLIKDFGK